VTAASRSEDLLHYRPLLRECHSYRRQCPIWGVRDSQPKKTDFRNIKAAFREKEKASSIKELGRDTQGTPKPELVLRGRPPFLGSAREKTILNLRQINSGKVGATAGTCTRRIEEGTRAVDLKSRHSDAGGVFANKREGLL